jgi:hypothetical protein
MVPRQRKATGSATRSAREGLVEGEARGRGGVGRLVAEQIDARVREAARGLGGAIVAVLVEVPLRLLDQQGQRQRAAPA